jgi:RNA polymerase sigma-70 factor (ECF subfamily)
MDQAVGSSSGQVTDRDLVRAAQGGDYEAFEEIVRRYHDRVFRLAYGMTKSDSEAEEVVQDTFLNVFKNLRSFRADSAPGSWIYRVAANSALMRLRTKRRKPLLSVEDLPAAENGGTEGGLWPVGAWARQPEDKLLSQELQTRLETAIAHLPEKYRLVLLLRDVEGLNNEEVADTLGLTVPTVKARLHRSRMFVRDEIDRYFKQK